MGPILSDRDSQNLGALGPGDTVPVEVGPEGIRQSRGQVEIGVYTPVVSMVVSLLCPPLTRWASNKPLCRRLLWWEATKKTLRGLKTRASRRGGCRLLESNRVGDSATRSRGGIKYREQVLTPKAPKECVGTGFREDGSQGIGR